MFINTYRLIRKRTEEICAPLRTEDYVVQPIPDVSPPKWHLGHTTWFFETFILIPHAENYKPYNPDYNYVFNSYYETVGARVIRTDRGNLSRPTVNEIFLYRQHVDAAMAVLLYNDEKVNQLKDLIELGLQHEQQHQELLFTDIKYILGHNPLFPAYSADYPSIKKTDTETAYVEIPEGVYEIGYQGLGFCFDNELSRHKVYLKNFSVSSALVSNKEYLEFINDDGYKNFRYWHSEGWDWVNKNHITKPLYWHEIDKVWFNYTLRGLEPVSESEPLSHISYYEAHAYAEWKGLRLLTEFEWEVAAVQFEWGHRWEWTESAYLPYPDFKKPAGAIGEYNGKFMVNQMVLRGASEFTPAGHSRITYRNFFHPHLQWQCTGIRLAK
ncbi:ergothioneine biosynthesis protein EgtB [Rubrolithibacter danxiaensis]|uniref:ergothioneine biosynthesis protein EgtB n=1 Tax=Rubrolithibacter danxiaensis TaxID=3390805 RepID=UPI003BF7FDBA